MLFRSVQGLVEGSRAIGSAGEAMKDSYRFLELSGVFTAGNEFVLTYTAMCFGTFAFAAVVLVIAALLLKLISMAVKQKNKLGRVTGIGCGLLLLLHGAGYVLANAGVIMPEQIYCPFSVGGREMMVTYVLMGVVLSIYRYQNISET